MKTVAELERDLRGVLRELFEKHLAQVDRACAIALANGMPYVYTWCEEAGEVGGVTHLPVKLVVSFEPPTPGTPLRDGRFQRIELDPGTLDVERKDGP